MVLTLWHGAGRARDWRTWPTAGNLCRNRQVISQTTRQLRELPRKSLDQNDGTWFGATVRLSLGSVPQDGVSFILEGMQLVDD